MIIETNENFEELVPNGVLSSVQEIEHKAIFSVAGIQWRVNLLLGHILTTVDASLTDPVQRKAMKDVIKHYAHTMMNEVRQEAISPQAAVSYDHVGSKSKEQEV